MPHNQEAQAEIAQQSPVDAPGLWLWAGEPWSVTLTLTAEAMRETMRRLTMTCLPAAPMLLLAACIGQPTATTVTVSLVEFAVGLRACSRLTGRLLAVVALAPRNAIDRR